MGFLDIIYTKPSAWLGFQRRYNFPLFVIFAGAMFGFSLARLPYLSPKEYANGASPGEWYWQRTGHYRVGLLLHLACVLPAGLLMVFQFVPIIRRKAIILHRINGYTIVVLTVLSNIGALMIVRRAFGGGLPTQAGVGAVVIMTTVSIAMAIYNIRKLQIDQHRAWMLRAMFYMGTIITLRLIMIIAAQVVTAVGSYYTTMTCGEVEYIQRNNLSYLEQTYPECLVADRSHNVVVHASFAGGNAEEIGASLRINFGMAFWLALLLHAAGVEIYLRLTPRESERLRNVSYERQLEAGAKFPGSAGLVAERFGDADPWSPRDSSDDSLDSKVKKGQVEDEAR